MKFIRWAVVISLAATLHLQAQVPASPSSATGPTMAQTLDFVGKQIGWHNFRHLLTNNLRAMGVDVKMAQELLRHADSRTLDIYTRAVSQQKRDANSRLVEMHLPTGMKKLQHPRSSGRRFGDDCNSLVLKGYLVDLIGIEPMTSSMQFVGESPYY
jgi:hypothetical protein